MRGFGRGLVGLAPLTLNRPPRDPATARSQGADAVRLYLPGRAACRQLRRPRSAPRAGRGLREEDERDRRKSAVRNP